ncbi:MAG: DUF4301 family protein [Bacteroidia bacterium]|nr:DUF4301 family protein [Bacteroidia bacterium]
MFTKEDLNQMKQLGINPKVAEKQIEFFKSGFPFVELDRPAIDKDGIKVFSEKEIAELTKLYDKNTENENIVKFVPASGAATRMFKDLFSFMDEWTGSVDIENDKKFSMVLEFFEKLPQFAFYNELSEVLKKEYNLNIEEEFKQDNYISIISALLTQKGLNYSNLPKALLSFHSYKNEVRTSFEEHLAEGAKYAVSANNNVNIHFTVTPEHLAIFKALVKKVQSKYEKLFNVIFHISYSIQKSSTDTIAVKLDNEPFRSADKKLLFRPGGHGALIENLNEIDASIIFIKNIDNVVPDHLKKQTVIYKKTIGGLLIKVRDQIFDFLLRINNGENSDNFVKEICQFYKKYFFVELKISKDKSKILEEIKSILNRPIRICGMVKNLGEPGGGPYWVKSANGNSSLQIIESSQIDYSNKIQLDTFKKASHFNPVDLVCAVKDFNGKKFNLTEFIDPDTGFISKKSKDGMDLKALELPGLWNGAMAYWNTIFVEVPIITFNPVKTVNDLLRNEHQPLEK